MRRWHIVLFVATLALAMAAVPVSADDDDDVIQITGGEVSFGAIEVRTGEYAGDCAPRPNGTCVEGGDIFLIPGWKNLMDPNYNYCTITEGSIEWTGRRTARLFTVENCDNRGNLPSPKGHDKLLTFYWGGFFKMTPNPDSIYPTLWQNVPTLTGCDLNGTFPTYYGFMRGDRLYAKAFYYDTCDGGTAWSKFGIGAEDGPIYTFYEFDLTLDD